MDGFGYGLSVCASMTGSSGVRRILIDGVTGDERSIGADSRQYPLARYLSDYGAGPIYLLVVTHPHEDHVGAVPRLFDLLDIREVAANTVPPDDDLRAYSFGALTLALLPPPSAALRNSNAEPRAEAEARIDKKLNASSIAAAVFASDVAPIP